MLEISIRFNIQERRNDWLLIEEDFSFYQACSDKMVACVAAGLAKSNFKKRNFLLVFLLQKSLAAKFSMSPLSFCLIEGSFFQEGVN